MEITCEKCPIGRRTWTHCEKIGQHSLLLPGPDCPFVVIEELRGMQKAEMSIEHAKCIVMDDRKLGGHPQGCKVWAVNTQRDALHLRVISMNAEYFETGTVVEICEPIKRGAKP